MPPDDAKPAPEPVGLADAAAREVTRKADPDLVRAVQQSVGETPGPLLRRRWFDDWADRLVFLVFFLGGSGTILALKLLAKNALLVAVIAAALLLGYAVIARVSPFLRLHSDRLGDNCYYLGLLYTLSSLAAALYQIESAADIAQRDVLIERLLGSFGVALVSTILGIALRIFFLQMRREVDDLEEQIRQELNARAMDLKDKMLFAVTELESFRLRTHQVLDERLTQATDAFAQNARAQSVALGELSARIMAQMDRTFSRHAASAEALNETTRDIVNAGAELVEKVRALDVPKDLLARRVDAMGQRLAKASERVEEGADALAQRLGTIQAPADLVTAKLAPIMSGFAQTVSQAAGTIDQASKAISGGEGRLREATDQLAGAVATIGRALGGLENLQRTLPNAAPAVQAFVAAMEAQAQSIRAIATASAEDARVVRAHRDQLLSDLQQSREALGRTQETLTQIVRVITERLGA